MINESEPNKNESQSKASLIQAIKDKYEPKIRDAAGIVDQMTIETKMQAEIDIISPPPVIDHKLMLEGSDDSDTRA